MALDAVIQDLESTLTEIKKHQGVETHKSRIDAIRKLDLFVNEAKADLTKLSYEQIIHTVKMAELRVRAHGSFGIKGEYGSIFLTEIQAFITRQEKAHKDMQSIAKNKEKPEKPEEKNTHPTFYGLFAPKSNHLSKAEKNLISKLESFIKQEKDASALNIARLMLITLNANSYKKEQDPAAKALAVSRNASYIRYHCVYLHHPQLKQLIGAFNMLGKQQDIEDIYRGHKSWIY